MTREDVGDEGGTHPPVDPFRCGQRYAASPSLHLRQDKSDWEGSVRL